LKNSKVVLFLSPEKVGQSGNFWTHPRTSPTKVVVLCLVEMKAENTLRFAYYTPISNVTKIHLALPELLCPYTWPVDSGSLIGCPPKYESA